MLRPHQSPAKVDVQQIVERILSSGQLSCQDYVQLTSIILSDLALSGKDRHRINQISDLALSDKDRHRINQIFDQLQTGRLSLVDW